MRDISEFLVELGPIAPQHPLPIKATYHDACGLSHAQKIRQPPRQLLQMIPGLELVPLPESEFCCGAAGSYNITQPEMAEQLGDRKSAEHPRHRGAGRLHRQRRLLAANRPLLREQRAGSCGWRIPVDALWASYSGEMPTQAAADAGKLARAYAGVRHQV